MTHYTEIFSRRMEAGDHFQNALKPAYRAALIATDALYLFGDRPETLKLTAAALSVSARVQGS